MKAAVFHGPGDVRVEEVASPELKSGDALLRIRACGICGSDLHTYRHGMFEDLGMPIETGRIMGHEFSGEVVEINGDISGIRIGDRVCAVSMGGNAEFARIPGRGMPMTPIPDGVSFEEAATVEPLATSHHAVNLAGPSEGETHVILGAGIIGLGVLQVLKATANVKTVVVDLSDKRLDTAREQGADVIVNASREDALEKVMELTGEEKMSFMTTTSTAKADTVYDCAGLMKSFMGTPPIQQAITMTKQNGKVVVVAIFEKFGEIDYNLMVRKGITIFGSWGWVVEEFRDSLGLIEAGKVDRMKLVSHQFPLDRAGEAYETQLKADDAVKVLIKP